MSKLTLLGKNTLSILQKNGPSILTGIGVTGLVTTAVLTQKGTVDALELLEEELYQEIGDEVYEYTTKDRYRQFTIKARISKTWRCYTPAIAMGFASGICIIGANKINLRRNAALASLYGITEKAFGEYKDRVVETIGRSKEQTIRDEVAADRVKKNPPNASEVIIVSKNDTLFCDGLSGKYFESDPEKVKQGINRFNQQLLSESFLSVNDLYYEIGVKPNDMGRIAGWEMGDSVEIRFSAQITENDRPCLYLDYVTLPKTKYYK